ncbi:MAG: hypothetical protein PUC82_04320 [bacterium]|nr:hypothetical protein [bacterium]
MKKYYKLTENKSQYITNLEENDDNTLTVTFGDNKTHSDIENTPENIEKIESKMEEQMASAIGRSKEYVLRSILATASVITTETGALVLKQTESLQKTELGQALTGTVLLVGGAITVTWCIREWSRVSEISKVKYRNKHEDQLKNIDEYSHALDSSSSRIRSLFDEENPLGICNVDKYKKSDLKKIIKEEKREDAMKKTLGVTYVKTK